MYEFKTLSSYDFELLSRDLLQRRLNIIIESFKPGKDEGVDLRYASTRDGSFVVQCKHYVQTGFPGLLAALRKERAKVNRLRPHRYSVVTSVPLSPANKREIKELFHPFCCYDADIFGQEDLNNFLTLYPDIERQHYKLWLTSSTVMERIVHSDVYNQTLLLVESIQAKAKLYVQNSSFFDALTILKDCNYCIISGIPGIGKSFLADILLLEYIRQGFEPVVVRSHISEAFRLLKTGRRQVFYYDDFLGQTGWDDKLDKNEEQSILEFIAYVRRHEHAVFILSTREYILQQARNLYEKLHAANFDHAKCIINLASYTRRNKAHILFNHLFFSDLSPDHRKALTRKDCLLKIIDHESYSPRIVEWMVGVDNIRGCSANDYPRLFLSTLDNPAMLWQHAYRNHLTPVARSLLLVLYSFQVSVALEDLREAFDALRLQEVKMLGVARTANEFDSALDELEGSFVRCERGSRAIVVSFHNPSVRDFLEQHLSNNTEQAEILCNSLVFYDQLRAVFTPQAMLYQRAPVRLGNGVDDETIAKAVLRTISQTAMRHTLFSKADGTWGVSNLVTTTVEMNAAHAMKMTKALSPKYGIMIAEGVLRKEEERLSGGYAVLADLPLILAASDNIPEIEATRNRLIIAASVAFEANVIYEELEDIVALKDFIEVAPEAVSETLIQRVREILENNGDEIFDSNITNADDESELYDLEKTVSAIENVFNLRLEHIQELIEEQKEQIRMQIDGPPDDWYERNAEELVDASDADIVAIFGSMFE